jgi:carboxypeptidase C (cathepsin A)
MTKIPSLKVFIACGYFDLATPFCGIESTVNQMALSKELRANIRQAYYEGGHMIYLNKPAMAKLNGELKEFFEAAAK